MNHINILNLAKAYNEQSTYKYGVNNTRDVSVQVVAETKELMDFLIKETISYCGERVYEVKSRQLTVLGLPYKVVIDFTHLGVNRGTILRCVHSDVILYYYHKFNSNILPDLLPCLSKNGKFLNIPIHRKYDYISDISDDELYELWYTIQTESEKRVIYEYIKQEQLEVL